MKWVIAQVILILAVVLLPGSDNFEVSDDLAFVALLLFSAGVTLGIAAIYYLRHSLSAAPHPIQNGQLQTYGLYQHIRHPMYVAVWLIMLGYVLSTGTWWKLVSIIPIVLFFVIKSRHEEKLLMKQYKGYRAYMKEVGAFFPKMN
jgi:protein-S-isoprenylcysteine O-methyltransferase Ste14